MLCFKNGAMIVSPAMQTGINPVRDQLPGYGRALGKISDVVLRPQSYRYNYKAAKDVKLMKYSAGRCDLYTGKFPADQDTQC